MNSPGGLPRASPVPVAAVAHALAEYASGWRAPFTSTSGAVTVTVTATAISAALERMHWAALERCARAGGRLLLFSVPFARAEPIVNAMELATSRTGSVHIERSSADCYSDRIRGIWRVRSCVMPAAEATATESTAEALGRAVMRKGGKLIAHARSQRALRSGRVPSGV